MSVAGILFPSIDLYGPGYDTGCRVYGHPDPTNNLKLVKERVGSGRSLVCYSPLMKHITSYC